MLHIFAHVGKLICLDFCLGWFIKSSACSTMYSYKQNITKFISNENFYLCFTFLPNKMV